MTFPVPLSGARASTLMWAQEYAWRNRQTMLALVQRAFDEWYPGVVVWVEPILCHHN